MTSRPAPLVPADCDLRDFAFMPLDVARLRDSDLAANETPEACWAAVLLWAASWHQVPAGSIPNDDRWIAKTAGYAHRGKIAREWKAVREGALRNWVECDDGRLYHPVVAEKANAAWEGRIRQRWMTECARIKKHNQRHTMSLEIPSLEDWVSSGCPSGQALPVPGDTNRRPQDSTGDKASKGEGEGEGQRERESPLAPQGASRDMLGAIEPRLPARARAKPRSAIPAHWQPTEKLVAWLREEARKRGVTLKRLEVEAQTEAMIDHHASKGNVWADHDAVWRRWMRNYLAGWGRGPIPSGRSSPSGEAFRV
ncbi:uncharacterized protein DUF1376 [Enterovirga rhinocerotis]|uniref:Uncharacterized protein DUF1376 n=1 Tax=Enterovirga rhinocerotis TaxID=1339210 RepID=A0A4V3DXY1_9HYPH|nr:uncharacterized protein DUF1376 [Enterovirga rhinocerotis]